MKVGVWVVTVLCLLTYARSSELIEDEEKIGNKEKSPDWLSLCSCAKPALKRMHAKLADYTAGVSGKKRPPLDEVISDIKEMAYNCTKQQRCKCPKGYFKTNDGYNCLKISDEKVTCEEAKTVCSDIVNSQLAIAKDHARLTSLADYIEEADPEDEDNYWIGLSYNQTSGGLPMWTWEDGSAANYQITRNLKNNVRKSLISINVEEGEIIERVTINKRYQGTKQESCGTPSNGARMVRHKYICEFIMFKVDIRAVTSTAASNGLGVARAQSGIVSH